MLGNFSFGDYFKEEAIAWAWDLITNVFSLDEDRLWISVYKEDEEAEKIWKKILKNKDRIIKRGAEDNFWQMGTEGPCGPCSEIIYDQGDAAGCRQPECNVNCNCGRFLELWNIVLWNLIEKKMANLYH
jgi:alanyl-tRNA synthetase